jgi:Flp pilus assembly protein TadD
VLASLGYSSRVPEGPGRRAQILRIILGTLVVAGAALVLWQIGASNGLLPKTPWTSARSPAHAPAAAGEAVPTSPAKREPAADLSKRAAVPAAIPADAAASSGATAAPTPVLPRETKPLEIASPAATTATAARARVGPPPEKTPSNAASPGKPAAVDPARKPDVTPSRKPVAVPPPAAAEVPPASRPEPRAPAVSRGVERSFAAAPLVAAAPPAGVAARGASSVSRFPAGETDRFKLALYYQRTGDFENALVQYRAVLEVNELNPEAHNNLGLLYQDKGLFEEAIREFRRATFIDPKYITAHNNLGVALLRSGNVDAAVLEFKSIAAIEPRNVEVLTNLALAQRSNGRAEEARETLQRALSIDNRYAAAHYNLALILEENGDLARAIEHYERFLSSAGAEHASLAGEVRARVQTLRAKIGQ